MAIAYRAEIDGLRALSVLAVVFYHAELSLNGFGFLSGGFIGVDVFFVISGYLISSIITKDMDRGRFSFKNFYQRRAQRILPMLFIVIACTFPVSYVLLGTDALKEYLTTVLSSIWFSSNFVFFFQDGYYAAPSALKPLLHTWSLAVEEQFYIIFPVLYFGLYKYCRRYLPVVLLVIFLLSICLAEYGSRHFSSATFFLLPTRTWELLAGVLLALLEKKRIENALSQYREALSMIGFFLLISSFFLFNEYTRHPSLITLIPVAGTLLLIFSCGGNDLVSRILRNKHLVFIGLISYSLYLWHFPIFALGRNVTDELNLLTKTSMIIGSFALSVFSFKYIESPLRNYTRISSASFIKGIVFLSLTLSILSFSIWDKIDKQQKEVQIGTLIVDLEEEREKRFSKIINDCKKIGKGHCNEKQQGVKNILIVGDSMVDDAYNILTKVFPSYHYIRSSMGGCPPHPNITSVLTFDLPGLQDCLELNRTRFSADALEGIDGLVINNQLGWFSADDLVFYFDFLKSHKMENVLLFGNYISLHKDFPDLHGVADEQLTYEDLKKAKEIESEFAFENELRRLSEEYKFEFVSFKDAACTSKACTIYVRNYPYTWDTFHFSFEFSEYMAESLELILNSTWLAFPDK